MIAAPRQELRRGLLWLGSAFGAARVIDLVTTIVVLWFITKADMGAAAVVWTIGVFIEAFNGLGVGVAVVQAPDVERRQLDSAFWFVMAVAVVLAGLTIAGGPVLADFYGDPLLELYVWAVAAKLFFVGGALLPIQLLNRRLAYREIAAIQTVATLLAAVARIVIAWFDGGAWALVLGNTLHGVFTLIIAQAINPFWPRLHFAYAEIRGLVHFGVRAAASSGVYHLFRNIDYLVVGRVFGLPALAIYRLAFDIAMEPAIAVGEVVYRTALPVFARVAASLEALRDAVLWSLRTLATLLVPIAVVLTLTASDLTALVGDREGGDYAAAATPLVVLALAAAMRALFQLLRPLFHGTGHPGTVLKLDLAVLGSLLAAMAVLFPLWGQELGVTTMALAWLVIYPPMLAVGAARMSRLLGLSPRLLTAGLRTPLVVGLGVAAVGLAARAAATQWLPELRLVVTVTAITTAYAAYLRWIARVSLRQLLRPATAIAAKEAS